MPYIIRWDRDNGEILYIESFEYVGKGYLYCFTDHEDKAYRFRRAPRVALKKLKRAHEGCTGKMIQRVKK